MSGKATQAEFSAIILNSSHKVPSLLARSSKAFISRGVLIINCFISCCPIKHSLLIIRSASFSISINDVYESATGLLNNLIITSAVSFYDDNQLSSFPVSQSMGLWGLSNDSHGPFSGFSSQSQHKKTQYFLVIKTIQSSSRFCI